MKPYNIIFRLGPFGVARYPHEDAIVVGFEYGLHYFMEEAETWPLFICALNEDELELRDGRFSNFTMDFQNVEFSIVRNAAGFSSANIDGAIEAANDCNRPWTFRVVKYRADTRFTFSFVNDTHMVEFRLRC